MNEKVEINVSCKCQMHKDLIKRNYTSWAALVTVNILMEDIMNQKLNICRETKCVKLRWSAFAGTSAVI